MSHWVFTALVYLMSLGIQAQPSKPERVVSGSEITSSHDPRATITLPDTAIHVGADRWALFGIADCEIHVFVEANAHKAVQRLYWVQFEGFVPERPELKHTYRDPVQQLWGTDFYVRADFGPTDDIPKPGSDLEHVKKLIRAAGYTMPAAILNVRMVHLLDDAKRRELMIIYMEDASLSGIESWKDLMPDGKKAHDWPAMQKALLERVQKNVIVRMK
jgi:hypothetical protein